MKYIFHHIPKAGGSSVVTAMRKSMKARRAAFQNREKSPHGFVGQGPGLYSSHYLFRDYEPRDGEVYFTWIRDPVDMFYSGFYYYRNRQMRDYQPEETGEFLRNVLRRHRDIYSYVDDVLENRYEYAFPRGLLDLDYSKFHFIGVAERMQEFMDLFNRRYGLDVPCLHVNQSEGEGRDYRRDEVRELLAHEVEIYEGLL